MLSVAHSHQSNAGAEKISSFDFASGEMAMSVGWLLEVMEKYEP